MIRTMVTAGFLTLAAIATIIVGLIIIALTVDILRNCL